MGLSLIAAGIYIPQFVKRRKLGELWEATAGAFQSPAPIMKGLSFDEGLKSYALFTREKAEEAVRRKRETEVRSLLYGNAFKIGRKLQTDFQVSTMEEALRMARIIYKILGIDFRWNQNGDIVIRKCFFSSFYSGDICRVISSLDAGLLAGLSGGSRLDFQQRITEGNECCRASLRIPESST
jgi:hypothetical protein